jgi:ADP-ribose pyrophosphatase
MRATSRASRAGALASATGAGARFLQANCDAEVEVGSLLRAQENFAPTGGMMTKKRGPWTIKATHQKFKNELIELNEDEVTKPDGSEGVYATVSMLEGVAVLAVGDDGTAYFIKEFRYALGRENVEVVAGGVEGGEETVDAARRELREELGIEAEEFVGLGAVEYATSILKSASTLFLARGLRFTGKDEDASEIIGTVKMPLEEAVARSLGGDFIHAVTALLVLRAHDHLRRQARGVSP